MNKSVLKNGNIYPPFLESGPMPPAPRLAWRNPQGVLPVSAVPRFAIASSVDTHAHVFERGLPMPDARRYAPDEDALLGTYLHHLDTHGMADRKSTRLNSSHQIISYAVFCLKKKKTTITAQDS